MSFVLLGFAYAKAAFKTLVKLIPALVLLCRTQKGKISSQVISHFVFLGYTRVKAARKYAGEIEP